MKTLSAALCALALLAGCSAPEKTLAHNPAAPIKIGAVLPFSGGVELYGRQAKVGLDLAAKEINAAGGILGHPVEVIYEDDGTRPWIAAKAVRKLVGRDHVFALAGPITSQNLRVLKPYSQRHKTPLLYATNYEGGMCGKYFFSFNTVPNQELGQLLPYMNKHYGDTYFLLGADRDWPHAMFAVAEPLIAKTGGRVVGKEYTLGTEKDFTPLIRRIAASKAKVLVFALKGDGLNFINQAREQGLLNQVTVAFLGLSEIELPIFHGKAQNMHVTVPFVASGRSPEVRKFVAKVKASAGGETTVSHYVMAHYNALMALKAAIEKAGKVDREAVVRAFDGLVINTPTGPLAVGKDHHSTMNLFLAKSDNLRLATVRSLGEVAPEPGCKSAR
ncbi:MAG TPA: substrate-binding protein [Terrimicrobiaceae bacterium]|nr:substrate-binding protein [Terrimicrobiaceae bacterium]